MTVCVSPQGHQLGGLNRQKFILSLPWRREVRDQRASGVRSFRRF